MMIRFVSLLYLLIFNAATAFLPHLLAPEQVVIHQLEHLRLADFYGAFRFSSPQNKQVSGPWHKFADMVQQNAAFTPLISHRKAEPLLQIRAPGRLRILVRVTPDPSRSPNRSHVEYWWELVQQGPDSSFADSWMVVAVIPNFVDFGSTEIMTSRKTGHR